MTRQLGFWERERAQMRIQTTWSSANRTWTLEDVHQKLGEIERKGFIPVPENIYRTDDGIIGQILEREFGVQENNLSVRDLGTYELKGMRIKSTTLTLGHKTTSHGLTPLEIFDRFGYVRPSRRNPEIIKKKLFVTVDGRRPNSLGLVLGAAGKTSFEMYYQARDTTELEYLSTWDIADSISKWDSVLLVFAETIGKTNARDEKFHYVRAWLLSGLKDIDYLVDEGIIKVDLCIDQAVGSPRAPHDRGPHIRIAKRQLARAYNEVIEIFP